MLAAAPCPGCPLHSPGGGVSILVSPPAGAAPWSVPVPADADAANWGVAFEGLLKCHESRVSSSPGSRTHRGWGLGAE